MLDWPAIVAMCALAGVAGAIAKFIYDRAFADSSAKEAAIQAAAAVGRLTMLGTEFSRHEVAQAADIAELRANIASVKERQAESDKRIATALEHLSEQVSDIAKDVGEQVRGVNDRLNRMLESRDYRETVR